MWLGLFKDSECSQSLKFLSFLIFRLWKFDVVKLNGLELFAWEAQIESDWNLEVETLNRIDFWVLITFTSGLLTVYGA